MILPPPNERIVSETATGRFRDNIQLTLSNPGLWLVAASLTFAGCCRYGFTDWASCS